MIIRLSHLGHPRLQMVAALATLFLQRTPVLKVVAETQFRSGIGVPGILKSAFLAAVALGRLDAQTGATQFTSNPSSPATATVGQEFQLVFTIVGATGNPGSWTVTGSLPPGLSLTGAVEDPAGTYKFNSENGIITGTPTQPGSYELTIVAWQFAGQSGDSIGSAIIPPLVINVEGGAASLEITSHPQSASLQVGQPFELTVGVDASPAPTFQWQKDGQPIPNATQSSFSIPQVGVSDAGSYTVVVTNSSGSLTSDPAVLAILGDGPEVLADPVSQVTLTGGGASFIVSVAGDPTPEIQWLKDGLPITGATGPILNLSGIGPSDAGSYAAEVSNALGTVVSAAAVLSIDADGFSRLSNLSTRTLVSGTTLIPGFAIEGSGEGIVLARAVGPTLDSLGVGGAMADPQIRIVREGSNLVTNDNWGDFPDQTLLEETRTRLGAFALDSGSADAGLVVSLDTGPYSMPTTGVAGSAGVVLVEVYDAGLFGANQPRLVNLSARSQVGTGSNRLIPGFVIEGDVAKTVLIRAVGPTLANFNVQGVLGDPVMRLFSGNLELAVNDNWGTGTDTDLIESTAATVGAFPIDPASRDSALQITLNPGAYTVQVAGVENTTGVCLVEVYEVPPAP